MRLGIVLLEYRVGCTLQQGKTNRLHNLCDVIRTSSHCCQTAVNVYQRHPAMKPYAILSHDARCRTGLTLGEMG
ncbi:hypothetical protein TNCV_1988361 [Trichonephila clavipes]|nr:hypothetical protein TNCV_1988361 [Trichonephila clavipes]